MGSLMLEGTFALVMSSPVSGTKEVTWRVYDSVDLAMPTRYRVEGVRTTFV